MSVAPQDLAASRWKPIRQALARIEKAETAQAASNTHLQQLQAQIGPAEHRDRQALGRALVDRKPEPASEAAKLRIELEQEQARTEALAVEVETSRHKIGELVDAHRNEWRSKAMRELARAKNRYANAITELENSREALSDEASLVGWLDCGAGIAAASDPLGGRTAHPSLSFARVLEELRADGEAIAQHPVTRDDPADEPRLELAWRGR